MTNTYVNRLGTALSLQQPTGRWTNGLSYDAARRLTNVTSSAGSFAHTLGGSGSGSPLVKSLLLPNTSYITNIYDSVARLTNTALKNSGCTVLDSYVYALNPANQRTSLTPADASTVAFRDDKISQLTVADSSVSGEDTGYFYDAAWNVNRRTNNGVTQTFSVNSQNELTRLQDPVYRKWKGEELLAFLICVLSDLGVRNSQPPEDLTQRPRRAQRGGIRWALRTGLRKRAAAHGATCRSPDNPDNRSGRLTVERRGG